MDSAASQSSDVGRPEFAFNGEARACAVGERFAGGVRARGAISDFLFDIPRHEAFVEACRLVVNRSLVNTPKRATMAVTKTRLSTATPGPYACADVSLAPV